MGKKKNENMLKRTWQQKEGALIGPRGTNEREAFQGQTNFIIVYASIQIGERRGKIINHGFVPADNVAIAREHTESRIDGLKSGTFQ